MGRDSGVVPAFTQLLQLFFQGRQRLKKPPPSVVAPRLAAAFTSAWSTSSFMPCTPPRVLAIQHQQCKCQTFFCLQKIDLKFFKWRIFVEFQSFLSASSAAARAAFLVRWINFATASFFLESTSCRTHLDSGCCSVLEWGTPLKKGEQRKITFFLQQSWS